MSSTYIGHSDYLSKVYQPESYGRLIKAATKTIRAYRKKVKFDAIAFRGTSGAAVAYPLGAALRIPLVNVRKPNEHSHGNEIEGVAGHIATYIIVDDFICSGNTVRAIGDALSCIQCVGIFIYNRNEKYEYNVRSEPLPPNVVSVMPLVGDCE